MLLDSAMIRRRPISRAIAVMLLTSTAACVELSEKEGPPPPWASVVVEERLHDFGAIVQGSAVEHRFQMRNRGRESLELEVDEVPEAVTLGDFATVVPAGESIELPVTLDSSGLHGTGELRVRLKTNDPETPELSLSLTGEIVQKVEIEPQNRVYFLDLSRGSTAEQEVRLVNHQQAPLEILDVIPGEPRYFETELEILEEGQEYRLSVRTALPDAVGTFEETISIETDSADFPTLALRAVARVREAVYAEPDRVGFGRFDFEHLGSKNFATKRVRVRKPGATGFALLDVSSDVGSLDFEIEVETEGESYFVTATIDAARARKGPLDGTVRIATNDSDFPELELPVSGEIL